jgi:hypothetical protein
LEPYIGPLQGRTEITRYQMVNMDTAERMKVNLIPTLSITFTDRPAEGREVLSTLEGVRQYIDGMVVPTLRALL